MTDLVGRTFGRWRVQRPLAHGGRGALFEARATDVPELRRAIRFIEAPDQAEIHRFQVEYDVLCTRPANVVRVYDFGVAEEGPRLTHLVMEFPDDESLASRMTRGALPVRDALGIGIDVAVAAAAIHRAGIAHLDIKPANILVRGDSATLAGFGASQRVGALDLGSWERAPAYLAPERLRRTTPVTWASDVYALGATLFELLTGERVMGATGPMNTSAALRRPDVPPRLAELVAQMLAPEPADRPAASEVARILAVVGEPLGVLNRPPPDLDRGTGIVTTPQPYGGMPQKRSGGVFARIGGLFQQLFVRDSYPVMPAPAPAPEPTKPEPGPPEIKDAKPVPRGGDPAPEPKPTKPDLWLAEVKKARPVPPQGGPTTSPLLFPGDSGDTSNLESAPTSQPDTTGLLFWNIGFPGNDAVRSSKVLITGTPYALETALQTARAVHSFSLAQVAAKDIVGEGAEAPVAFVIEARGARVRAPGGHDWLASIASEGLTCRATGTGAFQVEVQADTAGPVSIIVALRVRGAVTLRQTLDLNAVGIPGAAHEAGPPAAPPDDIEISAEAIHAIPEATLVLRLEPSERWYGLGIAAGGVEDAATLHTCATTAEIAKEAVLARKQLVGLSKRYRAEPAAEDDPLAGLRPADHGEALLEIARIGRRLHALLFGEPEDNVPLDLTRVADLIRGHGRGTEAAPRLQIDAETLPFPWGIVYDALGPLDGIADVAVDGFWGRRFAIDRTISAILRSLPPPTLDGAIQPCLNPHLDSEQSLQVIASQRGFFKRIEGRTVVRPAIESGEQLRAYLLDEGIAAPAILYFFCHARAAHEMSDQLFQIAATADEQASLMLDATGSQAELSVGDLRRLRKSPLKRRPLVFLNACSSAEADQYYQSQFLTLFVSQWQARAFIGSDWKIPTAFADAFARRALDRFLGHDAESPRLALGAALHATVAEVLALGNPFALIYALYGRPELQAAAA